MRVIMAKAVALGLLLFCLDVKAFLKQRFMVCRPSLEAKFSRWTALSSSPEDVVIEDERWTLEALYLGENSKARLSMQVLKSRISDATEEDLKKYTPKTRDSALLLPPLVFIHGSFHSAWCFKENFMPHFASLGYPCYAVSLRGTSPTGLPLASECENEIEFNQEQRSNKKTVRIEEHVADMKQVLNRVCEEQGCGSISDDSDAAIPDSNNGLGMGNDSVRERPVIIAHSFGGMVTMKLLEDKFVRDQLSGVALLCSVPPSGNSDMVKRFVQRNAFIAFDIVWGFVFKAATRNLNNCRKLFFDHSVPDQDIQRYMAHFKDDSEVVLDVGALMAVLPSITSMDTRSGVADWIVGNAGTTAGNTCTRNRGDSRQEVLATSINRLVVGAEKDYVVDRHGVEETAKYLGTTLSGTSNVQQPEQQQEEEAQEEEEEETNDDGQQPKKEGRGVFVSLPVGVGGCSLVTLPGAYHDVMLGPTWKQTAHVLQQWLSNWIQ